MTNFHLSNSVLAVIESGVHLICYREIVLISVASYHAREMYTDPSEKRYL